MNEFVEFLYRALDAEVGIAISTSDPDRLQAKLYAARKATPDPRLAELSITPSRTAPGMELWVVRKTPRNPDRET